MEYCYNNNNLKINLKIAKSLFEPDDPSKVDQLKIMPFQLTFVG